MRELSSASARAATCVLLFLSACSSPPPHANGPCWACPRDQPVCIDAGADSHCGCVGDEDCSSGQVCDRVENFCRRCRSSNDCDLFLGCRPDGTCGVCATDSDYSLGGHCEFGICGQRCDVDAGQVGCGALQFLAALKLDGGLHRALFGCQFPGPGQDELFCVVSQGHWSPPDDPMPKCQPSCTTDADCAAGRRCATGDCTCGSNGDCPSGTVCNRDGRCGPCDSNEECPCGQVCGLDHGCHAPCGSDVDCGLDAGTFRDPPRRCASDGRCLFCLTDSNCGQGSGCYDGRCFRTCTESVWCGTCGSNGLCAGCGPLVRGPGDAGAPSATCP